MALSLIAFDTDHIKSYVFGTDKLKEIRGASSLLDRLNRWHMKNVARNLPVETHLIYANGGAGLFLVDTQRAREFGQLVQQIYRERSGGRASVTYVIQPLPDPDKLKMRPKIDLSAAARDVLQQYRDENIRDLLSRDLKPELDLLRYKLREEKDHSHETIIALPSHPFIRYCDSCGLEYAEALAPPAPGEPEAFYCASCRRKQKEDYALRRYIPYSIERIKAHKRVSDDYLWNRMLARLARIDYEMPDGVERPEDFNDFRLFDRSKSYLGLIYADGNNMGLQVENKRCLVDVCTFARQIDDNVHQALSIAIKKHLPTEEVEKDGKKVHLFPFDILLIGGDDIVMVTEATKAMEVALTTAREFRRLSGNAYTLSVGVVLAPVNYPFALVRKLAESALKYAKSESAKARAENKDDDTRINFLSVTGGSSDNFKRIFDETYHKKPSTKDHGPHDAEFFATLRPFTVQDLQTLLKAITDSKVKNYNLGRTKLHQIREAILKMDLTTSVSQGLTILRSWRDTPRNYVVQRVYEFGGLRTLPHNDPRDPASGFPRVTFPWFLDKKNDDGQEVYRTPLLDFIELYDFVSTSGEESENAH